jgi:uncharacterized GH25 family protein
MNSRNHFLFFALLFAVLNVPASSAFAHHLWLNATRYNIEEPAGPSASEKTTVYFGWGDYYPVHDFLRAGQLKRFSLQPPAGDARELTAGNGGFLATPIEFPAKGTYRVAAELHSRYVAEIVEDGKSRIELKPKDELPKNANVVESKLGMQFAKAIINVGEIDVRDQSVSAPVGHDLEIIPLKNPIHLREGDYLPFKILFKGAVLKSPLAAPEIKATFLGFSTGKGEFAWSGELNREGIMKMKLIRSGVWQVHVVHSQAPPPDLAGKADKVEYKASLTFEAP